MARFFSHRELERGLITTRETVTEPASRIMELGRFRDGRAVIFGSVAWGEHTWRSDIDIADFYGQIGDGYTESKVSAFFRERYGNEDGFYVFEHLVEVLSNQNSKRQAYELPEISPSTRDHFRLLAKAKGGPYAEFYKELQVIRFHKRTVDISQYLEVIIGHWRCASAHLMVDSNWLNWNEFKILQALENFPKQLMRKILGEKKLLPSLDTASRIKEAFALIQEPWGAGIASSFSAVL